MGRVQVLAEGALELLDGALVQPLLLHDPVDDGDVQRHHRDRGAGLGDHRLEHGHVGLATAGLERRIDRVRGAVQVFLGLAQRTVPVDRPGDLGADVAEGHGLGVGGQHPGLVQRVDPQLPVLAAHHGDGVGDLLGAGRLDRGLDDLVAVGVHRGGLVGLADRLERRALEFAGVGQAPHRRGQRIHHQVDRAAHFAGQLDRLGAHLVGERIAVDRAAPQARLLGIAVEGGRVVPAGIAGLLLGAGLFEEHAQGGCAVAEGGGDARGQAVAGGRADHQYPFGAIAAHALGLHVLDLVEHVLRAAQRMGGGADEASDFGMDDHDMPLRMRKETPASCHRRSLAV